MDLLSSTFRAELYTIFQMVLLPKMVSPCQDLPTVHMHAQSILLSLTFSQVISSAAPASTNVMEQDKEVALIGPTKDYGERRTKYGASSFGS